MGALELSHLRAPLRTIYDLFIRNLRIFVSNDLG